MVAQFLRYERKYETTVVPNVGKDPKYAELGWWVQFQRLEHKKLEEEMKSKSS